MAESRFRDIRFGKGAVHDISRTRRQGTSAAGGISSDYPAPARLALRAAQRGRGHVCSPMWARLVSDPVG